MNDRHPAAVGTTCSITGNFDFENSTLIDRIIGREALASGR
jgi:hypothetical protein